jgi:DNA-directed RNA polymerase specialized sigma24 family protein
LRWIKGFTAQELAERFGKTESAIHNHFQKLRKKDYRVPGLSEKERKEIMKLMGTKPLASKSRSKQLA